MRFELFHQIQNRPLDPKFHFHFYHFPLTEDCSHLHLPYAFNSLLYEKCTPKHSLKKAAWVGWGGWEGGRCRREEIWERVYM